MEKSRFLNMTKTTEKHIGVATAYLKNIIEGLPELQEDSFDLAIADPPYGASSKTDWNLIENHNLDGFGGGWKLAQHEWDQISADESFRFTIWWLQQLKRLVKPTGSIWIHATYHNAGFVNVACQMLGLEIINEVIWYKRNAFPNLSGRRLTASHETIYWVHTGENKREYRFNYEEVKAASFPEDQLKKTGKQLRTVWDIPNNKKRDEITYGAHPTQKPLRLTKRLLMISGVEGGRLLVPFMGSGTEMISGLRYGMLPVGFEVDEEYFSVACQRIEDETNRVKQLKLGFEE